MFVLRDHLRLVWGGERKKRKGGEKKEGRGPMPAASTKQTYEAEKKREGKKKCRGERKRGKKKVKGLPYPLPLVEPIPKGKESSGRRRKRGRCNGTIPLFRCAVRGKKEGKKQTNFQHPAHLSLVAPVGGKGGGGVRGGRESPNGGEKKKKKKGVSEEGKGKGPGPCDNCLSFLSPCVVIHEKKEKGREKFPGEKKGEKGGRGKEGPSPVASTHKRAQPFPVTKGKKRKERKK